MLTYPKELAHDVRLPGGALIHIRPIRAADELGLLALFDRLSMSSRYQRFFSALRRLPHKWLHYFANVDYCERLALIAERQSGATLEILGVARYEPTASEDTREIALVVEDRWQAKGLGKVLLDDLLRAGNERGVARFRAYVLADNRRMLSLIATLGTVAERSLQDGVVEMLFTRK